MATATRAASARSELAAGAWAQLRRIADDPAAQSAQHRIMHGAGINGGPLRALQNLPLRGSMPMRELAATMRCDNSYVTALVDKLEERGLAVREPHPQDRRIKVIVLTAEGRRVAKQTQDVLSAPPPVFDALTERELNTLNTLLAKLGNPAD